MTELVTNHFWIILAISAFLCGVSVRIRVKSAKTKRDKAIYTAYSVLTVIATAGLIFFRIGG